MTDVVVAVATFHRVDRLPLLISLLRDQLDELAAESESIRASVIFIDNDPSGSAESPVAQHADSRIRYVIEAEPGVAAVRNRALDESAEADLLVFIDDDETPQVGWLSSLLRTWREFEAHGVSGPVNSVPDSEPDAWILASRSNERLHRAGVATGTTIDRSATNNLLLDRRWLHGAGIRFDERFGLTGGEDSFFTRQMVAGGARLVWCAEAIVDERVPPERMNRAYNLHRAYSLANAAARVEILLQPARRRIFARIRLVAIAAMRLGAGAARTLFGSATRSIARRAAGERWVARALGESAAAFGFAAKPYKRK